MAALQSAAKRRHLSGAHLLAGIFDLKTPKDLLEKLGRDLERLRAAPNDTDHAFNFFVTAEHMPDWLHPGNKGKRDRERKRQGGDAARASLASRERCQTF